EMEARGFQYEAAEASFELLVRRSLPGYVAPFELLDVLVLVEKRKGIEMLAEATIKVRVGELQMHTAAEGNGPVNALDGALRKALLEVYPALVASTSSTTRCACSIRRPAPARSCASRSSRATARVEVGRRSEPRRTSSRRAGW